MSSSLFLYAYQKSREAEDIAALHIKAVSFCLLAVYYCKLEWMILHVRCMCRGRPVPRQFSFVRSYLQFRTLYIMLKLSTLIWVQFWLRFILLPETKANVQHVYCWIRWYLPPNREQGWVALCLLASASVIMQRRGGNESWDLSFSLVESSSRQN